MAVQWPLPSAARFWPGSGKLGFSFEKQEEQPKGKVTKMCTHDCGNNDFPAQTDAYYEAVARQEEIYLEETEEEVRLILESDHRPFIPAESPRQTSERLAEELIAIEFQELGQG